MAFIAAGSCEPLRVWSRLEPRAREIDFADALAARIHDPMFMLGRQWQFGELAGEDGGSAVLATLARQVTRVVTAGAGPDDGLDLVVERLPIQFPLLVRARLGRTLTCRLDAAAAREPGLSPGYDPAAYRALFAAAFGPLDADPVDVVGQARDRATPRSVRVRHSLRGRSVDGVRVYEALPAGTTVNQLPAGLVGGVPTGHQKLVVGVLEDYRQWFEATYPQAASGGSHWQGDQLEYAADSTAARDPGTVTLSAAEHVGGHLDWYSYDQGATAPGLASAAQTDVRTVIPVPAEFPGMPKPRWWQFEDAAVDLGKLRADATDAARIVVTEFALLFGNNWFNLTCRQPVGTIAELQGVVVTDVFGWRTLVLPATAATGADWTGWDAFSLSPRPSGPPAAPLPQHLFLPATLPHICDGEPTETVAFVRDETADMVWAVERRVGNGLGGSRDGAEAARRLRRELAPDALSGPPAAGSPGALRYVLQTEVAENWIPFIPVHKPNETRAIRLQRAAMSRVVEPIGSLVRPSTSILREGVAADDDSATAYFVNEEEVPRAGVVVSGLMRRARRYDGTPVVWNARRVATGRGEGRSGLAFDRVESPAS